ncbi:MAG: UrcA family protein [Steroidobacteraceae bacterium]|jgi:UrcA family protein
MYIQHCSNLARSASHSSKRIRKALFAALVALAGGICALMPVSGHADEFAPVSIRVNIAGLDPNTVEGARKIYGRLERAAWTACGESESDIQVLATGGPSTCVKDALANAVRAVRSAEVAQLYVMHIGKRTAAAYGVTPEILTAQK